MYFVRSTFCLNLNNSEFITTLSSITRTLYYHENWLLVIQNDSETRAYEMLHISQNDQNNQEKIAIQGSLASASLAV